MNATAAWTPEREKLLRLHESGMTPREIANATGVSTQRVYQQLAKLELAPNRKPSVRCQGCGSTTSTATFIGGTCDECHPDRNSV